MKKYIYILLAVMILSFTACGSSKKETVAEPVKEEEPEAEPVVEEAEEVVNNVEEETEDQEITGDEGIDDSVPATPIDELAGKTSFDSYDEIIDVLNGNSYAYAYVNMYGCDEQVMFISEFPIEQGGKIMADSVYVYMKNDKNKIAFASVIGASGPDSYYIATDDQGLIYFKMENEISTYCIAKETGGIMYKDYIMKADDDGKVSYKGFIRSENSLDESCQTDIDSDSDKEFSELMDQYDKATQIEFTML